MYSRYIPKQEDDGPFRVCLSQEAVNILGSSNDDFNENNDQLEEKNAMLKEIDELSNTSTSNGRQLRRHPIKWREVSTLEATRLMIRDVMIEECKEQESSSTSSTSFSSTSLSSLSSSNEQNCYDILSKYQLISDTAAKKQLGAPRIKMKNI